MKRSMILVSLIFLLLAIPAFAADTTPAPSPWEPAIQEFEKQDAANPPAPGQVLFLGSSSIVNWDLEKSFPELDALNRGFGGSCVSDSLYYFDRVVMPCKPRAIVFYAGDNDVASGKTAAQVVADTTALIARVHEELPETVVLYLPIKPSIARWEMWPTMKDINAQIAEMAEKDPLLEYVDVATPMLDDDGRPKKELLVEDGLHLNEAGYALWNGILKPYLEKLSKTDPTDRPDPTD